MRALRPFVLASAALAFAAPACSSSSKSTPEPEDAAVEASSGAADASDETDAVVCEPLAAANNPDACPVNWAQACGSGGFVCPPGKSFICTYPNAVKDSDGCPANGLLRCQVNVVLHPDGGNADGGATKKLCAP